MNNRQLQHAWRTVRGAGPGVFFAAFVIFGVISVVALRENYQHMVKLRQAVYTADENGGDVESALEHLRAYVGSHMNTSLSAGSNGVYPPVQLKYTYQRLVQAAGSSATNANAQVYSDAQKHCEQLIPNGFSGRYRLDCIESYVDQHGNGAAAPNIPDNLYKFDFVSPRWSPDVAGLSLVAAVLSLLICLVTFVLSRMRRT